MEKIIACCGIDCNTCEAKKATIANDDALRAEVAKKWRVEYNAPGITAEMINCTGCRAEGAKFGHCLDCEIRKCAISNNFQTCAECDKLDSCAIVKNVHQFAPHALQNLKDLN